MPQPGVSSASQAGTSGTWQSWPHQDRRTQVPPRPRPQHRPHPLPPSSKTNRAEPNRPSGDTLENTSQGLGTGGGGGQEAVPDQASEPLSGSWGRQVPTTLAASTCSHTRRQPSQPLWRPPKQKLTPLTGIPQYRRPRASLVRGSVALLPSCVLPKPLGAFIGTGERAVGGGQVGGPCGKRDGTCPQRTSGSGRSRGLRAQRPSLRPQGWRVASADCP